MIDPPKDLPDLADKIAQQIVALQAGAVSQQAEERAFPSKKLTRVQQSVQDIRIRTWEGVLALTLTGNQYEFDKADAYVESYRMKLRAQRGTP